MKPPFPKRIVARGASLIEVVIAMGVLAVAIPIVFGALAESGRSGVASEADTRSSWIVPQCLEEIRLSQQPAASFKTTPGQPFPAAGEVWAIAFSAEGKLLGKITKTVYEDSKGVRDFGGKPVAYIATLTATTPAVAEPAKPGAPAMLKAKISIEYPSAAPPGKRQKLDFYTRIP